MSTPENTQQGAVVVESKPKVKLTLNAKGAAQWEVTAVAGYDEGVYDEVLQQALRVHRQLLAELLPAGEPS